jgi:hypothetical protein
MKKCNKAKKKRANNFLLFKLPIFWLFFIDEKPPFKKSNQMGLSLYLRSKVKYTNNVPNSFSRNTLKK